MYEECKNVLMYKVRKVPHISTLNWSHMWMVQWFNKTLLSMHVRFSPLLMKLPWRVFKAKRTLESTEIIFSLYFVLWSFVLLQEFLLEIISFNYNTDYQQKRGWWINWFTVMLTSICYHEVYISSVCYICYSLSLRKKSL